MTTTPICARVADAIEAYLDDRLAPSESAAVRGHLASCKTCRERAAQRDPLAHFALLSQERPDAATMADFWEGVRAGCEREGSRTAAPPARFARWSTPAALAASLLLMVASALIVPRPAGPDLRVTRGPDARIDATAGAHPLPGTVEEVRTPDSRPVQIVTMTWLGEDGGAAAREAGEVAELVLIVDAGLELR